VVLRGGQGGKGSGWCVSGIGGRLRCGLCWVFGGGDVGLGSGEEGGGC